jgi:hypothetical protein
LNEADAMSQQAAVDKPCAKLTEFAQEWGFTNASAVDPSEIKVYREVRDACTGSKIP